MEDGSQAATVNELHCVIMDAIIATDAKNWHDVWMMQLRGGLSLDLKPLTLLGIDRRGEGKHLQRDSAAKRNLLGFVNDCHPSSADLAKNAIITQLGARGNQRR